MMLSHHNLFQKVLAIGLLNSFANDKLVSFVDKAKDSKAGKTCLMIADTFLRLELRRAPRDDEEIPDPVKKALSRLVRWAKAVVCLLDPRPMYLNTCVKDVFDLMKSDNKHFLEDTLKDSIKNDEFWKAKYQEVQKTTFAAKDWGSRLEELVDSLKRTSETNLSDENIDAVSKAIVPALSDWEKMREVLRGGATNELEQVMCPRLALLAQKVCSKVVNLHDGAPSQDIGVETDQLTGWLEKLQHDRAVAEALVQLQTWMTENQAALQTAKLHDFVTKAMESMAETNGIGALDLFALESLLSQTSSTGLDEDWWAHIVKVIFAYLKFQQDSFTEDRPLDIFAGTGYWLTSDE